MQPLVAKGVVLCINSLYGRLILYETVRSEGFGCRGDDNNSKRNIVEFMCRNTESENVEEAEIRDLLRKR